MLLQILAYDNANSECQKAIQPLKLTVLLLKEYLKACHGSGLEPYKMQLLAPALFLKGKEEMTLCAINVEKLDVLREIGKKKDLKMLNKKMRVHAYVQNAKKKINGQINTHLNIIKMGHSRNVMWGLA